MKKAIILFSILILGIKITHAQQLRPNSIIKANSLSFKTDVTPNGTMTVANDKSVFKNRKPKNQRFQLADPRTLNILMAFRQVFSDNRLKELLGEPSIMLTYYISLQGKVLDISYNLKTSTLVTANELEALSDAIKKCVSFKIEEEGQKNGDFFMISQRIAFKRILDKTQP